MYAAKYLLSIEEFLDAENGEALLARAFSYVDEERERKARRVRPGPVRAASLGAGLLLQAAVREAAAAGMCAPEGGGMGMAGDGLWNKPNNKPWNRPQVGLWADGEAGTTKIYEKQNEIKQYSVKGLLEFLYGTSPISLAYVYGKEGKPYFRDLPVYFNLSHSGEYVLCAVSTEEMGRTSSSTAGRMWGSWPGASFRSGSGRHWSGRERSGRGCSIGCGPGRKPMGS